MSAVEIIGNDILFQCSIYDEHDPEWVALSELV